MGFTFFGKRGIVGYLLPCLFRNLWVALMTLDFTCCICRYECLALCDSLVAMFVAWC